VGAKYATIVADPPWPFRFNAGAGGRRARSTTLGYPTMSLEDILALPVSDLALPDAHLYLWVTRDHYREGVGVKVARAWGFEPVTEIIWRKPNFGMGGFPRPGHEPLLICRRGKLPFGGPRNIHSVQTWAQRYDARRGCGKRNSAKPEGAMDLIEVVSPAPRVELFSRRHRLGWDVWGNQVESTIALAAD
jgi:N6-adenosine-specific RNA methylase IME4